MAPDLHAVKPRTVDGDELLTTLRDALTRYVAFPSAEAADAATLYVAASHAQPAWEHASRLVIKSPLKRCGKSRLQEVIAETCHRPLRTANCSTAALVRSIGGDDPPTILLDEADSVFGGRKAAKDGVAEDLRGFINAGHSRGAPYLRWDMTARQLEECPTFGMAVLAGIGDLPDTIEDRAVVISMRRRGNGEHVASFRRRSIPALHELREHLNAWVREHLTVLRDAEPDLPVEDRAADVWEPLVSIADLAGGDWPGRARRACLALTGESDADADSAGERLLSDMYQVWGDEDHLFTTLMLERLHKLDESPWGDWYGKPLQPVAWRPCSVPTGSSRETCAATSPIRPRGISELTCPTRGGVTSQPSRRPKTTKPLVRAGTALGRIAVPPSVPALTRTNTPVGTPGRTGRIPGLTCSTRPGPYRPAHPRRPLRAGFAASR